MRCTVFYHFWNSSSVFEPRSNGKKERPRLIVPVRSAKTRSVHNKPGRIKQYTVRCTLQLFELGGFTGSVVINRRKERLCSFQSINKSWVLPPVVVFNTPCCKIHPIGHFFKLKNIFIIYLIIVSQSNIVWFYSSYGCAKQSLFLLASFLAEE